MNVVIDLVAYNGEENKSLFLDIKFLKTAPAL